jgi:TolB protein
VAAAAVQAAGQNQNQQPEIEIVIGGEPGTPPRYAVPDFVAASPDAAEIAKTISQVLWDDLEFEREFYLIPRDTYSTIPAARSPEQVPFASWRELGADAVFFGSVQRSGDKVVVQVRLFNVRTRQQVFSKEYSGTASNPRLYAHTTADEVHQQQRALRGVARTKLTFVSDRNKERLLGPIDNREVKEIYISDYDGENQRRVTVGKTLNIAPRWSPDGRAIAYTSYRRGGANIFISNIFQGTLDEVTKGDRVGENWLPAWSPDGTRIAFSSTRDGNPEIYVVNRDGSNLRRITNHPGIDITPTWSPTGNQIAFTSDRTGTPQIYVVGSDGLNLAKRSSDGYCDRPTWSPAPYNEIAFSSRSGPGFDIRVIDLVTGRSSALTNGEGTNESPAYSPNGRHIVFTSTRSGKTQVFTMARDGRNVKQITRTGNNEKPDWSK